MKSTFNNAISSSLRKMLVVALFLMTAKASADCVVTSTNGYAVTMKVTPVQLVISTTSCTYGYNFNYKLNYDISFTGTNIPSNLYTLQGNVVASGYSDSFFDLPNNAGTGSVTTVGNTYTKSSNCATATISTYNPSVEIQISGPGISYQVISCPITALPIEMVSYTATKIEQGILLNWATDMERNDDYFTVERSTNGIEWSPIAQVKAAGNSTKLDSYSYTDEEIINEHQYYRIKQTDFDGKYTYSKVLAVDNSESSIETNVYPNPAIGSEVTLKIITSSKAPIEAEIFGAMGQKVASYTITPGNSWISQTIEVPTSGNMFFINILQNNTVIGKHQVLVK